MSDYAVFQLGAGRSGRASGPAGLLVRECAIAGAASVMARRGQAHALIELGSAVLGARFPCEPRWTEGHGCTVVWSGPEQWLIEAENSSQALELLSSPAFSSVAAMCDQGDSRVAWDLSGAHVREVLAKGVPIDLDPSRFRTGDVAWTRVEHIDVLLRQVSSDPVYRLSVARSYSASLWHWLSASAAEFGCEVVDQ